MTQDMINKIMTLNKTSLRLTCDEITAHSQRDYGSLTARLRLTISMLLMLTLGSTSVWGATINFNQPDGYYYLGNDAGDNGIDPYNGSDFNANFYMCPACSTTVSVNNYLGGDSEKPLITTYKSFSTITKTYSWAVWYIEAATGSNEGLFYIKHRDTGKYLVANDNSSPGATRRRVNLGPTTKPDGNDGLFYIQSDDNGTTYYIYPKEKKDGNNKYLTPSNGNKDDLSATSPNSWTGGIIGFYNAKVKNSAWHFVDAQCATPVVTYNTTSNKITITSTEDAIIYYTTDGSTTPDPNNAGGDNPTKVYDSNDKPTISATTVIKAVAIKPEMVNSKPPLLNSELATITIVLNPTVNVANPVGGIIYDGTAKQPEISVEYSETTIPTTEYEVSYSNNTDAGTATATIMNAEGGDYVVYGSTTFEIAQREATLAWSDTELQYTGSAQQPSATVSNLVGEDACTVMVTGGQTNVGSYTATATALSNTNYALPATATQSFSITPKSLGDGASIADGIVITVSKSGGSYVFVVKNGELTLTEGSDYTTTTSGQEVTITAVTGEGKNYTGSGIVVTMDSEGIDAGETDEYVATYKSSRDLVTPTGMTAYVITAVDVEEGTVTVSPVDYIPNGVPILLSADATFSGFSIKTTTPETPFSGTNLLQMASGTDAERTVELAQVYVYYHGEFVLTMEGTLTEGKFYLNNPTYPSAAPKFNALRIVRSETTKVDNGAIMKKEESSMKKWYTIDGRHLNAKPTRKGLYICNGKKVIMK